MRVDGMLRTYFIWDHNRLGQKSFTFLIILGKLLSPPFRDWFFVCRKELMTTIFKGSENKQYTMCNVPSSNRFLSSAISFNGALSVAQSWYIKTFPFKWLLLFKGRRNPQWYSYTNYLIYSYINCPVYFLVFSVMRGPISFFVCTILCRFSIRNREN